MVRVLELRRPQSRLLKPVCSKSGLCVVVWSGSGQEEFASFVGYKSGKWERREFG